MLEVIKGNVAGQRLFSRFGFREVRELLILERPSDTPPPPRVSGRWSLMGRQESLALAAEQGDSCPWTVQTKTLCNLVDVAGLRLSTPAGDSGWLLYEQRGSTLIGLACGTTAADPGAMTRQMLFHLHRAYPEATARFENLPTDDPHVAGFTAAGYVEAFRRVEMWRSNGAAEVLSGARIPDNRFGV